MSYELLYKHPDNFNSRAPGQCSQNMGKEEDCPEEPKVFTQSLCLIL